MSNIVSSIIQSQEVQADLRNTVREVHTDTTGKKYFFDYLALPSENLQAKLAAHAQEISDDLQNAEIQTNIHNALDQIPATFNFSSVSQNLSAIRTFYQTCSSWDAIRLGNYFFNLNLTDNQYQNFFGLSGQALTNFKAKLANAASVYATVVAEQGA